MIRTIWIALVILLFAVEAPAQDFSVSAISEDCKYATLKDRATGNEVTVEQGQYVEGLRVVKIGRSQVVLGSTEPDGTVLLRQLGMVHRMTPELRKP